LVTLQSHCPPLLLQVLFLPSKPSLLSNVPGGFWLLPKLYFYLVWWPELQARELRNTALSVNTGCYRKNVNWNRN
jgi:hypothetical protein